MNTPFRFVHNLKDYGITESDAKPWTSQGFASFIRSIPSLRKALARYP